MKQWWNTLNQDVSAMKQFVSWSWNTVIHVESGWISKETICFMVVKHRETCWIRMKHGHEIPWIRMKQYVSWSWNTLFHANETPWIRDGYHRDIYFLILIFCSLCFMVFRCAVLCCFISVSCCFIAVSCCFNHFLLLFHCCSIAVSLLFHCCFMLFQGVSLLCFILFHDHETGAVGTSLKVQPRAYLAVRR